MNYISANHNYDNGYIGLVDLDLGQLPPTLVVAGYELLIKSEFHISLICVKRIAALIDESDAAVIEADILDYFLEFIKTTPLSEYSPTDQFRLVKKDERVTLVVMVDVPGIRELFEGLELKYGKELPLQPTHITLYTLQPEAGIGILSREQLEQDSELLHNVPVKIEHPKAKN